MACILMKIVHHLRPDHNIKTIACVKQPAALGLKIQQLHHLRFNADKVNISNPLTPGHFPGNIKSRLNTDNPLHSPDLRNRFVS